MTLPALNPADDAFAARLPDGVVKRIEPRYLEERRGLFRGQGGLLVAPRNVDEVAAVIREANAARVGVVPYGGGTGLVGGQVIPDGPAPLILSLERMKAIRATYPNE
ncbi:MAG: FAD-binding protein, partial [Maritimibacter sp.]